MQAKVRGGSPGGRSETKGGGGGFVKESFTNSTPLSFTSSSRTAQKEVGFKPGVKERWSYRCTKWWIRRGRSDGWRNRWAGDGGTGAIYTYGNMVPSSSDDSAIRYSGFVHDTFSYNGTSRAELYDVCLVEFARWRQHFGGRAAWVKWIFLFYSRYATYRKSEWRQTFCHILQFRIVDRLENS